MNNKKRKHKKTKAIMIDENGKQKVITVDIIELPKDFKCVEIDLVVTI